jgi:uncharacterized repeat protein (TIGR01451 family)/gliding motility-associated-like protein
MLRPKFGFFLLFMALSIQLFAQRPFTCEDQFFLTFTANINSSLNEVTIDPQSLSTRFNVLNQNIGTDINAIGYRITDNFIYGINPNTYQLLRVDADGSVEVLSSPALNKFNAYYAGDITPDGRYLVLIGNTTAGTGLVVTTDIVQIDLTDPTYPATFTTVNQPAEIFDIAFHPVTRQLYAFDGATQRLCIINTTQGTISYPFPSTNAPFITGSLFFDAYATLYGYGSSAFNGPQNSLYLIDLTNGKSQLIASGAQVSASDGCSCPYTIELSKSVSARQIAPCSEVDYTLKITNTSTRPHTGIVLTDDLPAGFTFVSMVKNPLTGLVTSQPGDAQFRMEQIQLPEGESEIVIRVNSGNVPTGIYRNQAVLSNIPQSLGGQRLSDDLSTIVIDDSTSVEVIGIPFDTIQIVETICNAATSVTLDALASVQNVLPPFGFLWENGTKASTLEASQPGAYRVTFTSGCDTAYIHFVVGESKIEADILTPDQSALPLGDQLDIVAEVANTGKSTILQWSSNDTGSLSCIDCLTPTALPFNDATYILLAQNELGCEDADTLRVKVLKNREVYFPNVFQPNNSNSENAYFYPSGEANTKLTRLQVFTRWGELVYDKQNLDLGDVSNGWDGAYRGKKMNPGVFIWYAKILYLDGETAERFGDVTLVR